MTDPAFDLASETSKYTFVTLECDFFRFDGRGCWRLVGRGSKRLEGADIAISDRLMRDAMQARGLRTKRAVVAARLNLLIKVKSQSGIRRLRGKVA
jgi:Arc/MetJ family transcription regulator